MMESRDLFADLVHLSSQAKKAKHNVFDNQRFVKVSWHEQDALRRKADGLQTKEYRPVQELVTIPEDSSFLSSSETDEQVVPEMFTEQSAVSDKRSLPFGVTVSAPTTPLFPRRTTTPPRSSPLSRVVKLD